MLSVSTALTLTLRGEAALAHASRAEAGTLVLRADGAYERASTASAINAPHRMQVHATAARVSVAARNLDVYVTAVATPHGTFTEFQLAEAGHTEVYGAPMLPVLRLFVAVPEGAEPRVTFSSSVHEATATGVDLAGEPLPLQAPVPKLPEALEAAPFVRDAAAYAALTAAVVASTCLQHEANG